MNNPVTYSNTKKFEDLYTRVRRKERRMYTDEEVALLPVTDVTHPHHREWIIRKNSCKALLSYIQQKDTFTSILEVGCGNGWLSARLAKDIDAEVTGIDINTIEIEQARHVFTKIPGLNFLTGSIQTDILQDRKFDMILFAASIQYFPLLKQIINMSFEYLTLLGEIHIMDSPFYLQQEIMSARERTKEHYNRLGFPEMASHYYHHSIAELGDFQYKILHHPHSWKNKLSIKKNPFYWIVIKNRYS